jgi:hypothetical protein
MYQKYKRQHPTVEEEKRDQRQVTKIREKGNYDRGICWVVEVCSIRAGFGIAPMALILGTLRFPDEMRRWRHLVG